MMNNPIIASPAQGLLDESDEQATSAWIVVTQVKSDRVVYFTDDFEYQAPTAADWYYCSVYRGRLPPGMTLRNCWGWRFRGSVFVDAREESALSTRQTLLENNRAALLRILREKVETLRQPYQPSCSGGERVRALKLQEAQAYLASAETAGQTYDFLQAVALARHISMREAAQLVVSRAQEEYTVLFESERLREQLQVAITQARTEAELLELREWLLDKVYPALTEAMRYPRPHTEPLDDEAKLHDAQRLHESTRLKVQLRNAINQQRVSLHSEYTLNDEMRKHKLRLAQTWLAWPESVQEQVRAAGYQWQDQDFSVLASYAEARSLTITAAAQLLLQAATHDAVVLARTEQFKDNFLARIDALQSWRDIQELELELKELNTQLNAHLSEGAA